MAKEERARNWTFVVYPVCKENKTPANWRAIIDSYHIQWCESPLHNADLNGDGTEKKSHYHILVTFTGLKSYEQIQEITKSISATIPQKVANVKGLVRYFAHIDNPEKEQYNVSDIIGHGGFDVAANFNITATNRYQCIAEMMQYCIANNIIEIEDLLEYAMTERFTDWFALLCDNSAYIITAFLKSRRHRQKMLIDENGEVVYE